MIRGLCNCVGSTKEYKKVCGDGEVRKDGCDVKKVCLTFNAGALRFSVQGVPVLGLGRCAAALAALSASHCNQPKPALVRQRSPLLMSYSFVETN